ncbi:MAG: hypothetical protein IJZ32_06305 [Clostridia bacterium]|nr:hypothetical protein [Clostridia bacterium]
MLVVLSFCVIAVMRVVQKVCSKKVSDEVGGKTFFHYGGYYNLFSALFSLITLCIVGFHGFDTPTVLCALGTAVFMAIELFSSIEALKGCSLIVSQMFSVGALFIPCLIGIFLFDEPMSLWQWVGLALFMVSMYFLIAPAKKEDEQVKQKMSVKTLVMLVLSLIAGGFVMVLQKVFAVLVPDGNVATYSFLMFALNALLLYACYAVLAFQKTKQTVEKSDRGWKPLSKALLICGGFLALAVFAINQLVTTIAKTVPSAILYTVSYAISILITLLVGVFYYKEKLTVKNVVGIVLCLGSILIINLL